MAAVFQKFLSTSTMLPTRLLSEVQTLWPGLSRKYLSIYHKNMQSSTKMHESEENKGFSFIEYDTGPCTADQIILQADKYGSSLMECVSSDFEMDKGLVKCFEKSFKHRNLLKEKAVLPGNAAIIPYKDCYIYYLVTRERWWDRGCYRYLRSALASMKEHCIANNVKEICMGRLGSSVDGLDWKFVRELVIENFKDTEVTVKAQITR